MLLSHNFLNLLTKKMEWALLLQILGLLATICYFEHSDARLLLALSPFFLSGLLSPLLFLLFLSLPLSTSFKFQSFDWMTTSVPLASPLRRVNTPGLYPKSKLASEWERWSTTPNYFSGSEPPLDPVRYYQEFFCLTPNDKVQEEALERLGREALLDNVSSNSVWISQIAC